MADSGWHSSVVDTLNDVQLSRLLQDVAQEMSNRGQSAAALLTYHAHGRHSLESQFQEFGSTSSTFQHSGRSSRQSNSAYSGDTVLSQPVAALHPYNGIGTVQHPQTYDGTVWRAVQGICDGRQFGSTFPEESVQAESADRAMTHEATGTSMASPPPRLRLFCTYCYESGKTVSFKTKHDWKRHMKSFHETGFEWHCSVQNCTEVYSCEQYLKKHYAEIHGTKQYPRNSKAETPEKHVYACGFEGCRRRCSDWKHYCDHVYRCMEESNTNWSYTWKMRNLLRHPEIAPVWKRVKADWCKSLVINPAQLMWDPKTSRAVRLQLECLDFAPNLESVLEKVFKLGHPSHTVSPGFLCEPSPMDTLQLSPPAPAPVFGFQNTANELVHPDQHPFKISYADQRYQRQAGLADPNNSTGQFALSHGKRNTVMMLDAPPMVTRSTDVPEQGSDFLPSELMTVEDVLLSQNWTPPLPSTPPDVTHFQNYDTAKVSPIRNLMRKSKERLTHKRPQHVHQGTVSAQPEASAGNRRDPSSAGKYTASIPANFSLPNVPNYEP